MENIVYYLFCIIAIIIGIVLIKKFVGCLIRTIITLVLMAILAYIYFTVL